MVGWQGWLAERADKIAHFDVFEQLMKLAACCRFSISFSLRSSE